MEATCNHKKQININIMKYLFFLFIGFGMINAFSQNNLEQQFIDIEDKVIEWRRHFHQNPELSNREFKTAETIAKHLKALGLDVKTGVAHTGVVAILKGNKPGKVIALRADKNELESLPNGIATLLKLQRIDLSVNKITSLPMGIGGLLDLETFKISANQVDKLPSSIGKLKKLKMLDLGDNQIESLPSSVSLLAKLEYLYLGGNGIDEDAQQKISRILPETKIGW